MNRSNLTKDDIATLATTARLKLTDERKTILVDVMPGIFQMLDSLDDVPLGDTPPAFAFRAKWEGDQ